MRPLRSGPLGGIPGGEGIAPAGWGGIPQPINSCVIAVRLVPESLQVVQCAQAREVVSAAKGPHVSNSPRRGFAQ